MIKKPRQYPAGELIRGPLIEQKKLEERGDITEALGKTSQCP